MTHAEYSVEPGLFDIAVIGYDPDHCPASEEPGPRDKPAYTATLHHGDIIVGIDEIAAETDESKVVWSGNQQPFSETDGDIDQPAAAGPEGTSGQGCKQNVAAMSEQRTSVSQGRRCN